MYSYYELIAKTIFVIWPNCIRVFHITQFMWNTFGADIIRDQIEITKLPFHFGELIEKNT